MSPEMQHVTRYYRWIVSRLEPYIGAHVLDIGTGYGTHLEYILPVHPRVAAVDFSVETVRLLETRFSAYPDFEALRFDFGADDIDKLAAREFDTLISLNVLEHIEDDLAALRQMRTILQGQGGHVLLQVPAHAWLYGSLDAQAGHFRRYSAGDIKQKLAAAGFELVDVRYFNAFGVLPWLLNARILKRPLEDGGLNLQIKIFDRYLVPILRPLEAWLSPPVGQSVLAVGRARKAFGP